MKIGIFAVCVLLSGASASFLDTLTHAVTNVEHSLEGVIHQGLQGITTEGVSQVVQGLLPAAITAATTALAGKRDSDELQAVLQSAVSTVGKVVHSYANQLQKHHHDIQTLDFLKGDVQQFMSDIQNTKLTHNAALDSIVSNVKNYLNSLKSKKRQEAAAGGLLDGLNNLFSSTVDALKQTLGGVASSLQSGPGNLLQNIHDHLTGLASNSAGILASGQEALQNLHHQASTLFHQAQSGIQGQSSQLLDTLLHPASSN